MQIQRAAWRVLLDGKFSPRRQQRESFYFSGCGVCLRPVFGGSEVNKTAVEKEREKHGRCPSSPGRGGVLETEFGVMGFDPYCQMLLRFDSERGCRDGATQRKQKSKMASGSHQLLKFMAALSR
ncbi:unnamed protein product [Leuciscus chuanchicus]